MLRFITDKSWSILSKYTNVANNEQDIYIYGLELFYSTSFTLLSIFFISSVFLDNVLFGLIFILYFYPIRLFCGGYHCKTYKNCFLLTNLIFILSHFFAKLILYAEIKFIYKYNFFFWIFMYIIIIYFGLNSRVNLTLIQKSRNNKRMIVTLLLEMFLLGFIKTEQLLFYIAFMGTLSVTIMLLIAEGGKQ